MILDDPAFMPDFALPPLDFAGFENALNESQNSLLESQRSRSGSDLSSQNNQLEIQIPSSLVKGTPYQLPATPFGSSAHKTPSGFGMDSNSYDDEGQGLLDELDFEFDADGGMVEGDAEERARRRTGGVRNYGGLGRVESDSAASARVRQEHDDAFAGRLGGLGLGDDNGFVVQMDDGLVLPDADAFWSVPKGKPEASDLLTSKLSRVPTEVPVPAKKRKMAALKKAITDSDAINYRNADFKDWQEYYAANMVAKTNEKIALRVRNNAKANADAFLWGNGIGGIGRILGSVENGATHPLAIFCGDALRELMTGEPIVSPKRKRRDSVASTVEAEGDIRKRAHGDDSDPQLARGDDGVGMPVFGEDDAMPLDDPTAEIGREAMSPLAEHQSSAMPWNISTSLNSFRAGSSSLPRGRTQIRGSSVMGKPGPGSRVSAQSPLVGRGRLLSDFEDVAGSPSPPERGREIYTSGDAMALVGDDEFDMYGPGAAVDTQTAGNTQWLAEALETESYNFLEFVKNTATEIEIDEVMRHPGDKTWVGFEKMFPTGRSTNKVVAAQAFYHVLSLATKNLLGVNQEGGDVDSQVELFVKGVVV